MLATCVAIGGFTALYLGSNLISKNIEPVSITQDVQQKITVDIQTNNNIKKYKDGIYTGTGSGYRPNLQVEVTIKNGEISDINITSNNETPRFSNQAFAKVPNEIVKDQSTKVDGVSGVTRSSKGVKQAVEEALSKAKM